MNIACSAGVGVTEYRSNGENDEFDERPVCQQYKGNDIQMSRAFICNQELSPTHRYTDTPIPAGLSGHEMIH
jgi:hypothetical protein